MLLAVITPSEGAEAGGDASWCPKLSKEPGMDGLLNLDYWTVLPIIIMIVTGWIMRVQRHLSEVWKPRDEGPILARVGGANLPADGGRNSFCQLVKIYSGKNTGPVRLLLQCSGECAAEAIFCCPTENSNHLEA